MRIMKCNAHDKDWYMPWLLLFTTFALAGMACALLVLDVFTGVNRKITIAGFKERMHMAVTEVQDYTQHLRRCRRAYRERMR